MAPPVIKPWCHHLLPAMRKRQRVWQHLIRIYLTLKLAVNHHKVLNICSPGTSAPCYNDVEMLTEFTWDDRNIRRVFIRKVLRAFITTLITILAILFKAWPAHTSTCAICGIFFLCNLLSFRCTPFWWSSCWLLLLLWLFSHSGESVRSFSNLSPVLLILNKKLINVTGECTYQRLFYF